MSKRPLRAPGVSISQRWHLWNGDKVVYAAVKRASKAASEVCSLPVVVGSACSDGMLQWAHHSWAAHVQPDMQAITTSVVGATLPARLRRDTYLAQFINLEGVLVFCLEEIEMARCAKWLNVLCNLPEVPKMRADSNRNMECYTQGRANNGSPPEREADR